MEQATQETKVVETAKVKTPIINGRMPVAVVAQIRFGNDKGEATKVLAQKYGTTVGKIDDIKKNRNFAYVTADFAPTEAQINEGLEWLQRHPDFHTGTVDPIILELESTPVATPEQAAAFEVARGAARGTSVKTKEGDVADGGGGNRRKARGKKVEAAVEGEAAMVEAAMAEAPSGDDLLA